MLVVIQWAQIVRAWFTCMVELEMQTNNAFLSVYNKECHATWGEAAMKAQTSQPNHPRPESLPELGCCRFTDGDEVASRLGGAGHAEKYAGRQLQQRLQS